MRPFHLLAAGALLFAALPNGTAHATPPSGQFAFTDLARAEVTAAGSIRQPAGTDTVLAAYALAPGGDTGWRSTPGTTVLVVTAGTLTLHRGTDCATTEYPAGKAVVLPGGRYRLANTQGEPVEFSGTTMALRTGAGDPLLSGREAAAPGGC